MLSPEEILKKDMSRYEKLIDQKLIDSVSNISLDCFVHYGQPLSSINQEALLGVLDGYKEKGWVVTLTKGNLLFRDENIPEPPILEEPQRSFFSRLLGF